MKYSEDIPFVQTYTGKIVYLFAPKFEDIDIVDIAHSLALQCRYGGNVRKFYSVAEHCVRMSRVMEEALPKLAMSALLHDAPEAYLQDIVRPMKHAMKVVENDFYTTAELLYEELISNVFDLPYPMHEAVIMLDRIMGATERRDLHYNQDHDWNMGVGPLPTKIDPWPWETAERAFLKEYQRLEFTRKDAAA